MWKPDVFDIKGIPNLVYASLIKGETTNDYDDDDLTDQPFIERAILEFPPHIRTFRYKDHNEDLDFVDEAEPFRDRGYNYSFELMFPRTFVYMDRGCIYNVKKPSHRFTGYTNAFIFSSHKGASFYDSKMKLRMRSVRLPNTSRGIYAVCSGNNRISDQPFNVAVTDLNDVIWCRAWTDDLASLTRVFEDCEDRGITLVKWAQATKKSKGAGLKYAEQHIIRHDTDMAESLSDFLKNRRDELANEVEAESTSR